MAEWHQSWDFFVQPLALLHSIGRATSSAFLANAAVSLSSWWAVVRYLLAFSQDPGGSLRLSDAALGLRYHHRQAFSEYLGIGLTIAACEATFFGKSAQIADAEMPPAAPTPFGRAPRRPPRGLWPDYYLYDAAGQVVVLECKGNWGRRTRSRAQLARASCQVSQPTLPVSARRIAGSAVIDVPGAWLSGYAVELEQPDEPREGSRAEWYARRFRESAARSVSWAGGFEDAYLLAMGEQPVGQRLSAFTGPYGDSVGMTHNIAGVLIVTGSTVDAYAAYRNLDEHAVDDISARNAEQRLSDPRATSRLPFLLARGENSLWSRADDGSILGVVGGGL